MKGMDRKGGKIRNWQARSDTKSNAILSSEMSMVSMDSGLEIRCSFRSETKLIQT